MPGQYSTVTLVGPNTTRDLALPGNIPVAQLLPQLLRPGVMRTEAADTPATWMLTTVDGRRLAGASTLSELGIGDGEVLHLHDATDAVIAPPVEDLRDAVEDLTDGTGKTWKAGTGRVFATGIAALVVAATAVLGGDTVAVLLTGGLVCVLSILVTWWAARDNVMLTHLALAGGALWALRVGYEATAAIAPEGLAATPMRVVFGLCTALLVTVLGLIGTPLAIPYATALSGLCLLGAVAAAALAVGATVGQTASVVLLLALFTLGVLPRASMSTGSLFGLDREIQAGREVTTEALRWRLERVDAMLCGGLIAVSLAVGVASVVLTVSADPYSRLLGLGAAVALLTRSRIFDQIRHVAPLRVVGALAIGFGGWHWLAADPAARGWIPAIAVLACLAYAGLTMVDRSLVGRAKARRVVGVAEIVLVAALFGLAGQVTGLYAMITGMTH